MKNVRMIRWHDYYLIVIPSWLLSHLIVRLAGCERVMKLVYMRMIMMMQNWERLIVIIWSKSSMTKQVTKRMMIKMNAIQLKTHNPSASGWYFHLLAARFSVLLFWSQVFQCSSLYRWSLMQFKFNQLDDPRPICLTSTIDIDPSGETMILNQRGTAIRLLDLPWIIPYPWSATKCNRSDIEIY